MEPQNWSYSCLTAFEACGLRFLRRYVQGDKGRPSTIGLGGRILHDIIRDYNEHLTDAKLQTDIEAIESLAGDVFFSVRKDGTVAHREFEDVLFVARKFAQTHMLDFANVMSTEKFMHASVNGTKFVYKVDLFQMGNDGVGIVTDYKTGHDLMTPNQCQDDLQLNMYPLFLSRDYPDIETWRVVYDFVRHGKVREIVRTREDLERTQRKVLKLVERIRATTSVKPQVGSGCGICEFTHECPELRKAVKARQKPSCATEEEAKILAEEILILDTQSKERKTALKPFCSSHGPIEVGGMEFAHFPKKKIAYPVEATLEVLKSHNIPKPERTLKVDTSNLGSLIDNLSSDKAKQIWVELEQIKEDHSSTEFRYRRKKD